MENQQILESFLTNLDAKLSNTFDSFFKKIDAKLSSVLDVNSRLVKENIELRRKSIPKDVPIQEPPTFQDLSNKKKVIMEVVKNTGNFRFTGNGTFDAKEQIKTYGNAIFEKETKSWILTPNKTIEFITTELKKDFDLQFIEI